MTTNEQGQKPNRPKRVLIIEDNQNQAATLMHLLNSRGYEIRAVYDGSTGLVAISEFRPDFALIDIGLPGIHGYELARLIREDNNLDRTVLIAITAWTGDEDRAAALRAGFDYHFSKPIELARLEAVLAA